MRIALLTLSFPPQVGGVQQYLYEVSRWLAGQHRLVVVTPVAGRSGDAHLRRLVVKPTVLGLVRALLRLSPDCALLGHAHPRLLLAAAVAIQNRYATITHGNDYLTAQLRWHRPLFNWLLGRSRPLITMTCANAARLRQLGLPQSVVVYPGADPCRFTPPPVLPPLPLTLLTVGRLVPRKGLDTVIQALPALLTEFPDLRYRVAGDGPDRSRLQQMACDLGVAHAVEFLGPVPDEALAGVYRSAHIFVMPAREEKQAASVEGFGIVYLEASASGLPVVAGRSGGVAEAVREGETGFLVPPNDPESLVLVLRRLLTDPELRRRMGQAGRQWVEEEMGWDRAAAQIGQVLEVHR